LKDANEFYHFKSRQNNNNNKKNKKNKKRRTKENKILFRNNKYYLHFVLVLARALLPRPVLSIAGKISRISTFPILPKLLPSPTI